MSSFKLVGFAALFLVVAAVIVLAMQTRYDLQIAELIDSFTNKDTQTETAAENANEIEDKTNLATQEVIADARDADHSVSDESNVNNVSGTTNKETSATTKMDAKDSVAKDTTTETERHIEQYLSKAELSYRRQNYTQPEGENAIFYYNEILKLEPGNADAKKGLQKIEKKLADRALHTVDKGEVNEAKVLLAQLERINPGSDKVSEIRSRIVEIEKANREVTTLLSHAKTLMEKQRFVVPTSDNAYYVYRKIIEREPNNKDALEGINNIKAHYTELFNQHLTHSQFTDAENDLAVLKNLQINRVLYDGMEGKLASARAQERQAIEKTKQETLKQSQITLEQINELLGSFKLSMENRDFNELNKISEFSPGREQFIRQLFGQYKTMDVNISNVQFIPTRNKASAHVKLSNLIQNNGYQVMPGDWSRFEIDMRLDQDEDLKIHW